MTAVEWLVETIKYINDNFEEMLKDNPNLSKDHYISEAIKQAEEIEKQQIISAKMHSMTDDELSYINAEQYYNETYNNEWKKGDRG